MDLSLPQITILPLSTRQSTLNSRLPKKPLRPRPLSLINIWLTLSRPLIVPQRKSIPSNFSTIDDRRGMPPNDPLQFPQQLPKQHRQTTPPQNQKLPLLNETPLPITQRVSRRRTKIHERLPRQTLPRGPRLRLRTTVENQGTNNHPRKDRTEKRKRKYECRIDKKIKRTRNDQTSPRTTPEQKR